MMRGWLVVRELRDGSWHVVSTFTFPTRADALAHLDFVRHGVRKALRDDYRLAEVEPERRLDDAWADPWDAA